MNALGRAARAGCASAHDRFIAANAIEFSIGAIEGRVIVEVNKRFDGSDVFVGRNLFVYV
jgi:hypothetical protein